MLTRPAYATIRTNVVPAKPRDLLPAVVGVAVGALDVIRAPGAPLFFDVLVKAGGFGAAAWVVGLALEWGWHFTRARIDQERVELVAARVELEGWRRGPSDSYEALFSWLRGAQFKLVVGMDPETDADRWIADVKAFRREMHSGLEPHLLPHQREQLKRLHYKTKVWRQHAKSGDHLRHLAALSAIVDTLDALLEKYASR